MKRREPPPLATWMLEHLSSGDRDEALAGDLLEVFRAGRSNGWYWRQVCCASAVSWFNSLRSRIPLFVFALAWSMLAPAWTTIIDRIQATSRLYVFIRQLEWPFSGLSEFLSWVGLNVVLLWGGILIYFLFQLNPARAKSRRSIRGAFLKAAAYFLPAYFVTFVLANLFDYPGLDIDRRTLTALRELTDLRLWADFLRAPYLITLICALWKTVPVSRRNPQPGEPFSNELQEDESITLAQLDPFRLTRFFSLMVCVGLVNAMIVGFLLCRLPETRPSDVSSLFITASSYVLLGTLGGVSGSWIYWKSPYSPFREFAPLPFPLFALVCSAGWVWVTPMVLLAEQVSPATAVAAMIGAFVITTGLRLETYPVFASAGAGSAPIQINESDLFAQSTYHAHFEPHGYLIAIGVYAAAAAILTHSNYTASIWLGLSAAIFGWKKTIPRSHISTIRQAYRRATIRLAIVVLPAVAFTAWAMLDGIRHRNRIAAERAAAEALQNEVKTASPPKTSNFGSSGYESLILWPFPPKKELIAPVPVASPLLAPGTKQPLILRFNGTYEYVQPPDKHPGVTAHRSRGTPLHLDIESNNHFPVMMDAHQNLAWSIPTNRCSEIEVELENADNRIGLVSLGLLLEDGLPGHERTAYLGQQPIASTEPEHFYVKISPVTESVRFSVPVGSKLSKFSEITVLVLPDTEHMFVAPKIAIREFRLTPR